MASEVVAAAGPEEYMPGDTIERRACIALLTRLGAIDRKDSTNLAMAGLHHSIALNLVGCAKTFLHLGADSGGAAHWAASCKSHAALRELLRLGVEGDAVRGEWDGSSPLMLAAAHGDSCVLRAHLLGISAHVLLRKAGGQFSADRVAILRTAGPLRSGTASQSFSSMLQPRAIIACATFSRRPPPTRPRPPCYTSPPMPPPSFASR